ncbi:hypothetical protein D3C73_1307950 [compost metagenome]
MLVQIIRMFRDSKTLEVLRSAHHCPRDIRREALGNHVLWNSATKTDSGVVAITDDVDHFICHGQVNFDIGIALDKDGQNRSQQ